MHSSNKQTLQSSFVLNENAILKTNVYIIIIFKMEYKGIGMMCTNKITFLQKYYKPKVLQNNSSERFHMFSSQSIESDEHIQQNIQYNY